MSKPWLPPKDADLLAFCQAFSGNITSAPTDFGLVAADATLLATKVTGFQTSLAAIADPATRTAVTIAAKDIARDALMSDMRSLYKKIQAANLSADKLETLGLPIRSGPSPVPVPSIQPSIAIVSRIENTVRIRLFDPSEPARRGKPAGVDGAAIFSFVGETAPTTEAGWKFEGNVTRMIVDVVFPSTTPAGSKVWFTAFYFNPRAQSGPAATPVSTSLPGGAAMAA